MKRRSIFIPSARSLAVMFVVTAVFSLFMLTDARLDALISLALMPLTHLSNLSGDVFGVIAN